MLPFTPWCSRLRAVLLLPALLWPGFAQQPTPVRLPLHAERAANTDLALVGLLAGVPPGETRFVRWADLARLPQSRLRIAGELVRGEQELTVLFLSDLWAALPVREDADSLLARCADGYAAVYEAGFIRDYRPFLILQIDGLGPANWPPPGMKFNPGPYVISVSAAVVPAVAGLLDAGHKRPWTVTTLEVARLERSFGPFFAGPWAGASAVVRAGRELWIHSCASCHSGPPGTFGGTKGNRPFALLATQARSVPDFFQRYITDPKGLVPTATMEAHPAYTKAQLEALTAFVAAGAER